VPSVGSTGTVLAADWSGARVGAARHLWLARWDPVTGTVAEVEPMGPAAATACILRWADAEDSLVVGLDFAFSLPHWYLQACGIGSAEELWADETLRERWLEECPAPFWGRPGRRRPWPAGPWQWRRTELASAPRPASAFQVGGAGAVGTASLRGMGALHRLTRSGMGVWPFHPWRTPAVVEVWPRLALGRVVKSSFEARSAWVHAQGPTLAGKVAEAAQTSPDALDAVAAALALARRGARQRPPAADEIVRCEGWIDGVEGVDGATGLPPPPDSEARGA